MKRPIIALLLSGLVLPGLGQIYLGRRTMGIALIMAVNLLLLVALFFVMKVLSPVIGAHLTGTALTPALVMEKIQPYSAWAKLLLTAISVLWGLGVVDLFRSFRETVTTPRN